MPNRCIKHIAILKETLRRSLFSRNFIHIETAGLFDHVGIFLRWRRIPKNSKIYFLTSKDRKSNNKKVCQPAVGCFGSEISRTLRNMYDIKSLISAEVIILSISDQGKLDTNFILYISDHDGYTIPI